MYLGSTVENKCGHKVVSPKKAEKKTATIGAIIRAANIVANVDELFQLYKNTHVYILPSYSINYLLSKGS